LYTEFNKIDYLHNPCHAMMSYITEPRELVYDI